MWGSTAGSWGVSTLLLKNGSDSLLSTLSTHPKVPGVFGRHSRNGGNPENHIETLEDRLRGHDGRGAVLVALCCPALVGAGNTALKGFSYEVSH
jgi:hypothetical protein